MATTTTTIGDGNGRAIIGWAATATIRETTTTTKDANGKDVESKVRRLVITPAIDPTTRKPGANLFAEGAWVAKDVRIDPAATEALLASLAATTDDDGKPAPTTFGAWVASITNGQPFRLILPAVATTGRAHRTRVAVTDDDRANLLAALADDDGGETPAA